MISWLDGWLNTNESPIKFSHSSKTDVTLEKVKVWKTARSSGRIKLRPYVGCFGLFSFILIWPIAQRAYRQIKQTPDSFSFVWFRLFSLSAPIFKLSSLLNGYFLKRIFFCYLFGLTTGQNFNQEKDKWQLTRQRLCVCLRATWPWRPEHHRDFLKWRNKDREIKDKTLLSTMRHKVALGDLLRHKPSVTDQV